MTDKAQRSQITVFTQLLHIYSDVERRHDVFFLPDLPNATDQIHFIQNITVKVCLQCIIFDVLS